MFVEFDETCMLASGRNQLDSIAVSSFVDCLMNLIVQPPPFSDLDNFHPVLDERGRERRRKNASGKISGLSVKLKTFAWK